MYKFPVAFKFDRQFGSTATTSQISRRREHLREDVLYWNMGCFVCVSKSRHNISEKSKSCIWPTNPEYHDTLVWNISVKYSANGKRWRTCSISNQDPRRPLWSPTLWYIYGALAWPLVTGHLSSSSSLSTWQITRSRSSSVYNGALFCHDIADHSSHWSSTRRTENAHIHIVPMSILSCHITYRHTPTYIQENIND